MSLGCGDIVWGTWSDSELLLDLFHTPICPPATVTVGLNGFTCIHPNTALSNECEGVGISQHGCIYWVMYEWPWHMQFLRVNPFDKDIQLFLALVPFTKVSQPCHSNMPCQWWQISLGLAIRFIPQSQRSIQSSVTCLLGAWSVHTYCNGDDRRLAVSVLAWQEMSLNVLYNYHSKPRTNITPSNQYHSSIYTTSQGA